MFWAFKLSPSFSFIEYKYDSTLLYNMKTYPKILLHIMDSFCLLIRNIPFYILLHRPFISKHI